jgi:ketopantoate reductase
VATAVDGMPPADLLFVAVKSYQTEDAVRGALPVIGPVLSAMKTRKPAATLV